MSLRYMKLFKYFLYLLKVYIILLLHSAFNPIEANAETYKMTDRIFTCSKWLSSIIDNICNNVYRIVKRDASLLMGNNFNVLVYILARVICRFFIVAYCPGYYIIFRFYYCLKIQIAFLKFVS